MELCHQLHSLVQTMSDPLTLKETAQLDRIAKVRERERELTQCIFNSFIGL